MLTATLIPYGPAVTKTVLGPWAKVATIPRKQTAGIQGNPKTHMDLWSTTVGNGIKIEH